MGQQQKTNRDVEDLGMFFIGVLHTHPLSYQASSPVKGNYEKLGFALVGH